MARTATRSPTAAVSQAEAAAAATALEHSRYRWTGYLDAAEALPPSWPYDWRPDGSKPCKACDGRRWHQNPSGWACLSCHPPPTKEAA